MENKIAGHLAGRPASVVGTGGCASTGIGIDVGERFREIQGNYCQRENKLAKAKFGLRACCLMGLGSASLTGSYGHLWKCRVESWATLHRPGLKSACAGPAYPMAGGRGTLVPVARPARGRVPSNCKPSNGHSFWSGLVCPGIVPNASTEAKTRGLWPVARLVRAAAATAGSARCE